MSYFRRPSSPSASSSSSAFFPTFLAPSLPFRRKSRHNSNDSTSSTSSTFSRLSSTSSATTATSSTSTDISPSASSSSNPFSSSTYTLPPSSGPIIPPTSPLLTGHTSRLHCAKCSTDLCLTSQIISKGFTGRHGRAYLVQGSVSHVEAVDHATADASVSGNASLPNTFLEKAVPRNLVTGQHTVSDVMCAFCGTVLGWKYVEAREESQKYKVGKFILETRRIRVGVNWENDDEDDNNNNILSTSLGPIDELRRKGSARKESTGGDDATGTNGVVEFDSQDEDECEDLFAGVWSPRLAKKRRDRRMRFESRGRRGSVWASANTGTGNGGSSAGGEQAARARSEDTFY